MSTILTKALAIALVSILMVAMVAPQPAYAQGGLLSGITGILNGLNGAAAALQNFINNVMRPILEASAPRPPRCKTFSARYGISSNKSSGRSPRSIGFEGSCSN